MEIVVGVLNLAAVVVALAVVVVVCSVADCWEEGSDWLNFPARWRHCRIPLGCSFGYCHLRCGHEPRQTCFC